MGRIRRTRHVPLPEGPGKDVVTATSGRCHGISMIAGATGDWHRTVLDGMAARAQYRGAHRGAPVAVPLTVRDSGEPGCPVRARSE